MNNIPNTVKAYGHPWGHGIHPLVEKYKDDKVHMSGYDFGRDLEEGGIIERKQAVLNGHVIYRYRIDNITKNTPPPANGTRKETSPTFISNSPERLCGVRKTCVNDGLQRIS